MKELQAANDAAAQAFVRYRRSTGAQRAKLLRRVAQEIEALGDSLLETFCAETGLPRARAENERARTCAQLRLFATTVETDAWAEPRIYEADPARRPSTRPYLRSILRPLGPVVVFGPGNFPLAFGVAGGDTAAALAAGCPVIAKAHPGHPNVCQLVGDAVSRAVAACGWPAGVFTMVAGGPEVATALVELPAVRAVGFTGSSAAGRALLARCQARRVPIPFFGEMSGVNPVCLLPGALATRGAVIAEGLHGSVTLGGGHFCTKPGVVLYVDGEEGVRAFREKLTTLMRETPGATLRECDSVAFRETPQLQEEVWGASTLLVACRDLADMVATVEVLDGQLTATVHEASGDLRAAESGALLWALEERAGRLVFNGYPTGVEVCDAMVHGGPWPATTDSRFTSVGPTSMRRFVRPVCYQNAPVESLPWP